MLVIRILDPNNRDDLGVQYPALLELISKAEKMMLESIGGGIYNNEQPGEALTVEKVNQAIEGFDKRFPEAAALRKLLAKYEAVLTPRLRV